MQLFAIVGLYISAGSILALMFQYINLWFPDQLDYGYMMGTSGAIRWAMAMLMVVYPVFLFISSLIYKDYAKNPENRELKTRKWLIYFTLFVAALTMGGDLIALIYNFLEGDLSARFILKVLTIFIVAGTVFYIYLKDLRDELSKKSRQIFALVVSTFILSAIIAGFFTAGSPFVARMHRFDERRINDLQIIQNEIINYWQQKDKLPSALLDLKNDISGFVPPIDPKTSESYSYKVNTDLFFELCVNFELASDGLNLSRVKMPMAYPYGGGIYEQNWEHDKGEVCFSRTIDPDLYRVKPLKF